MKKMKIKKNGNPIPDTGKKKRNPKKVQSEKT
jgi:hypothetical protein